MLEPKTILGEAVNVVTDYLSLLVLTLPIAIIGRNFHLQYESFFRCVHNTQNSAVGHQFQSMCVYIDCV